MTRRNKQAGIVKPFLLVLAGFGVICALIALAQKTEQRTVSGLIAQKVPMHSINQCVRMEAYNVCLNAHRGAEDKTSEALRVYACQDGALQLAKRVTSTIPTECLGPPEQ